MVMENTEKGIEVIVARSPKSVGIGLLLTFLFGPIGMLYGTIWGCFLMMAIDLVLFIAAMASGIVMFGFILLVFTRPIELIWVTLSIRSYNKKLMKM